jgi:hypothetical protein
MDRFKNMTGVVLQNMVPTPAVHIKSNVARAQFLFHVGARCAASLKLKKHGNPNFLLVPGPSSFAADASQSIDHGEEISQ